MSTHTTSRDRTRIAFLLQRSAWAGVLFGGVMSAVGGLGISGMSGIASASVLARQPDPDEPIQLDEATMKAIMEEMRKQGIDPAALQIQAGDEGDEAPAKKADGKPPAPNAKAEADIKAEESLARFQQLLQRRPFHGAAFGGLVNYYAERGKLKDLVAEYEARVKALPDDVSQRIVLARLQLRAGDAQAAAAILDKITALPPDLARQGNELLVLKSEVYQKTGDNAGAERVLKEAQKNASSVSEQLRLGEALADLYLRTDRKNDAVTSLQALADQHPDNYLHQKHVAGALAQRGLYEAAVERLKKMQPLVKDDVERRCEVLRDLGQGYEKLSRRDDAIAAYIEAVGLLASDHWLVRELQDKIVALYRAGNRLEDLATYCRAQIERAPEQTAMRVLLADVQAALGKPDEGKKTLERAVELFPKDLALSQKRVEYLERLGDIDGVSAEYQRAIGQHGDDSELYISYGQFLAANRQVEGARNQWQHVLGTKLSDATLAVRLGALFEAYDLYDDAAGAYERAITVAPKQTEGYLALSRMHRVRGETDKAATALTRMGEANPDDGTMQGARAQALRDLGQLEDALAAITRACELMPDQVRFQQIRSELLAQNGKLDEALEARRVIIDKITNPIQQAEAIGTLVSMHVTADKLGALKAREEARLKDTPGSVVALLVLARIADSERDFPGVKTRLDAVLQAEPGNEMALTQLAKLQDATGDIDGAVATYTRLIERTPARARQFYEAIVDLKLRYGDRAGAVATLELMAKNDPASAATLGSVADQMVRMGDAERAIPYFEKALAVQPDRHETRLDYGKALFDAGRVEDAMAVYRVVATQRSDTDRAAEALGRLHDAASQLGRLEDLMDELQQQVEADPQNTLVARALAQLLVRELEYTRAIDLLDLVLRHNPRDADLALSRAEVLRRQAKYPEAIEAYQNVLRFPQIDRDYVLGELGKTYFESGQVDQARRLWKQVQHKLYAGSLLKNNGLVEDSIAVFEEGIRIKPDEYALHRNLIGALESSGRTPDALAAARRLLDIEPGNIWNIERLAEAHLRANDRAGAAQVAARLFSADVSRDKLGAAQSGSGSSGGAAYQSFASAMYSSSASQYAAYSYYGGGGQSNLERGVQFFLRNGLRAELEEALDAQMTLQPDNAMLRNAAATLYASQLNKPERALTLMRDLETANFPAEQQDWLGQCSQRDFMRIKQYNLIAGKPALRDKELTRLEAIKADQLTRDDLLLLAMIRSAQGSLDKSEELLRRAVQADNSDVLALGALTDLLVAAERFADAEPHARRLVAVLSERRAQMHAETLERVRRDFVRSLPVEFQLRVNEQLLSDIADKWTLGQGWSWRQAGAAQAVGYLRARLTLGTICAETDRMDEARTIWKDLAPSHGPDVDRWTMLGDTAQLHKQEDLAYEFYQNALKAAKTLSGDALLQQVYSSSTTQRSWYGQDDSIDKAFNGIVEAFSKRDSLVELYDFLRDTDQQGRARRIAEQYELTPKLKPIYEKRVADAAAAFKASRDGAMTASPAYFAQVCKLAELSDNAGDWAGAQKAYESYLADFPDELGLLTLLGEVAEARLQTEEAIAWEKKVLDCKTRLAKQAREWSLRDLALTPGVPQSLAGKIDAWSWSGRWGKNNWSYGGNRDELDCWPSWMRLAQLYLASNNTLAAADALQHAVAEAGPRRDMVVRESLNLIQQRRQTAQMLGVLRTLAVYAPSDERVQLAFAESLEAAGRKDTAMEVCNRMLRRGVSDLGLLAELRRRVGSLGPSDAAPEATLASLAEEVKADPSNLKARLRLAKAHYYALDLNKSQELLATLVTEAPNLEEVHELLIEIYTLRGDSDKLIAALKAQVERLTDDRKRRTARWRLVDELLAAGKSDEAMTTAKELGDPRDPRSYARIGALLHYFGRSDEAIACLEQAGKSKQSNQYSYGDRGGDFSVAQSLAMKGDYAASADKIMTAIDEQSRQQVQYGGAYGMYDQQGASFAALEPVFALYPDLATEVSKRVEARRTANPADVPALRLAMALHRSLGRPDKAEALLEQMAEEGSADQGMVAQRIDLAVKRGEYPKAIQLATKFIAQAPKPQIPPGMPAQYAGYAALQSPRVFMLCKLGDVYWDMGEKDKAFETYGQIVDKKIDETRLAYAAICLMRGRTDEARTLVDESLTGQKVKSPNLLQFRAFISVLDGQTERAFDALCEAAAPSGAQDEGDMYGRGASPVATLSTLAQRAGMMDKFDRFVQDRIKKSPEDWDNYSTLSNALWAAGRPDDALKVVDQAAQSPPLRQQALQTRLHWRESQAPVDELVDLYQKLIELAEREVQPSSGRGSQYGYSGYGGYGGHGGGAAPGQEYRNQLAAILWDKGEKEQAEKLWTERMNMQQAATHQQLGELYMQRFEYDKAQEAFKRAVELEPDDVSSRTTLAHEAFCRGDLKAMLPHMLEVYWKRSGGGDSEYGYGQRYGRGYGGGEVEPNQMCEWARALSADPQVTAFLSGEEVGEKAFEYRVMLASLTGDWATMESLLRDRIASGTPDPMIWRLWGKAQQRKSSWAEAAAAMEFLRRAGKTTIADHEDKLKLVLAGKQLKEAAAGTRQSQQAIAQMQQGMQRTSSSGGYYGGGYYGGGWWDSGSSSTVLPSLYIKLGDFQRAERLYLISSGEGGIEGKLPWLASLMWEQNAKPRALELMRLSLSLPSGDSYYSRGGRMLTQYATMLSETGKVDDACDLLVRAYRWNSGDSDGGMYAYMYGQQQQGMEQGEEQSVSGALHQILTKHGKLDAAITRLTADLAKDPADPQLGKLVMSLLKREQRWAELNDLLVARAASSKGDRALTVERIGVACQLAKWDEALTLVDQARRENPGRKSQWNGHEAFIHLMKKDSGKAIAAIKPLLDEPNAADNAIVWTTILAATNSLDQLTTQLQKERAEGSIDDSGRELLFRLLMKQKNHGEAFALASEQVWRKPTAWRSSDAWWRNVCRVAAAEPGLSLPADRPEDAALFTLAARGPAEGVRAFTAAVDAAGPAASTPDAIRGLLFAAMLAGDDKLVDTTNTRLISWLEPRRMTFWYAPQAPSLQAAAKRVIASADQYGGASQVALGGAMGQQMSQMIDGGGRGSAAVTYDELWKSHQIMRRSLLARAGQKDQLAGLIRDQARSLDSGYGSYGDDDYGAYYQQFGGRSGGYARGGFGGEPIDVHGDWRSQTRQYLARAGQFDVVDAEYATLAARTPTEERSLAGEAAAAVGRAQDAAAFRRSRADVLLASLQASDTPDIGGSAADPWRWYWYGYGSGAGNEDVMKLRQGLRVDSTDPMIDGRPAPLFYGEPGQLWEIALVDPDVEKRLLACEDLIGPGWGSSRTLAELVQFHRARKSADKVVALIEKSSDLEQILRSDQLHNYLWGCFRTRDAGRINALLAKAERAGENVRNDLDVARLVVLRISDKGREADEFESKLLARCVDELPNPHPIDPDLIVSAPMSQFSDDFDAAEMAVSFSRMFSAQMGSSYNSGYGYQAWQGYSQDRQLVSELADLPDLAQSLGVAYQRRVGQDDLTLADIREAYRRHGLYGDALRILDRELASAPTSREKQMLLAVKANAQARAGQKAEARQTAQEFEALLSKDLEKSPNDASTLLRLARLYASEAWGRDYAKAYETLTQARKSDPACDRNGQLTVNCLYRLGRHKEAFEAWRLSARQNELQAYEEPMIYYASLSALRAGEEAAGRTLARQALYRYPTSTLAQETRELIHDKP